MHLQKRFETTNATDRWVVLGNYSEQISDHATREEAMAAYHQIGADGPTTDELAEPPWPIVCVLAPGETLRGELFEPVKGWEPAPLPSDWPTFEKPTT